MDSPRTDGPVRVAASDAADDVDVVIPLPSCMGYAHATMLLAQGEADIESTAKVGIPHPGGVVLVNGRGCAYASPGAAAWFVDRLLGDSVEGRLRLRDCPTEFVTACVDRARDTGVLDRLEVVAPPTEVRTDRMAVTDDCPRTLDGVRCVHGYYRDERGYIVDDHLHMGYTADGARVEWLCGWQDSHYRHPRYSAWGIIADTLALIGLALLIIVYLGGVVYGGGGGYFNEPTADRIGEGIAAGALVLVAIRVVLLRTYVEQQWGPDPHKGHMP